MKHLVVIALLTACGSDGSPGATDAAMDSLLRPDGLFDGPSALALTSPVLADGATFAAANTCDDADTSPELAWTGDATGAQAFAITMTDTSIDLVHWAI